MLRSLAGPGERGGGFLLVGFATMFFAILAVFATPSAAASAWMLDPAASTITYQSVKKNSIVETNTIRNFSGGIAPDGAGTITFDLNSVDTGVDIRNVRMRFLFFETFKFPTAIVTTKVDPAEFAELAQKRRITKTLPFTLDLHGIRKDLSAEVVVTMLGEDMVSVASKSPVIVNVADFELLANVEKLQQAANVTNILPTASVSFDFVFGAGEQDVSGVQVAAVATGTTSNAPMLTDVSKEAFSDEECLNRFDTLSKTGSIYFRSGSARLDSASRPLLDEVLSVVTKCPRLKVEVAGYTDSDGSEAANQRLSEARANAVAAFIVDAGVSGGQISAAGYGEADPVMPNDSAKNKALNRRIEFSAQPLAQ